jgi:hypothetical protein
VKLHRCAGYGLRTLALALLWLLPAGFDCGMCAVAAPATPSTSAQALSFQATARFIDRATATGAAMPQQVFAAKVLIKGNRVRIESRLSDQPVVFLYASPYIYKLLPEAKAGVRWRAARPARHLLPDMENFDLQTLLRDPAAIRATLRRQGARRVTVTVLNGTPVEVFEARNFRGKGQNVKAWLRRGDALPLRLESNSRTLSTIVSWRNYQRPHLADSLFQAPAGYNIRNVQSQPSLL